VRTTTFPARVNPRELLGSRLRAVTGAGAASDGACFRTSCGAMNLMDGPWIHCAVELRDPAGNAHQTCSDGGVFSLLRWFRPRTRSGVLSRDQLLDYGSRPPMAESYDRAIDTQISRLRRKS